MKKLYWFVIRRALWEEHSQARMDPARWPVHLPNTATREALLWGQHSLFCKNIKLVYVMSYCLLGSLHSVWKLLWGGVHLRQDVVEGRGGEQVQGRLCRSEASRRTAGQVRCNWKGETLFCTRYCSGMKPNVTSTGFMRVVFRSNKDRRVQGGARCLVECSNNSSEIFLFFGWRLIFMLQLSADVIFVAVLVVRILRKKTCKSRH